jgi:signal transduction histidine kinase
LLDGGAIRNQPGSIAWKHYDVVAPSYQMLTAAREGGVWLAPTAGGISRVGTDGQQSVRIRAGVTPERFVAGVETRDGALWLRQRRRGFGRLRDGEYRDMALFGSSSPRVDAFVEDASGRLWLASRDKHSLTVLHGDSIVLEVPLPGGDAAWVTSLVAEGDTVWATTAAASLLRVVDRRVAEIRSPSLATTLRSVNGVAIARGWLWIAEPSRIARVPLHQLHRAANGEPVSLVPVAEDALDGLPVPHVSSMTPTPMRAAADGRIWIATPAGLAVADLESNPRRGSPPNVHIEEIAVSGVNAPLENGGSIGPNPDRVAIRFTATGVALPERLRIEYRLDGSDDEWSVASTPRVATYSQLRPGHYQFRVRAWNADGVPSAGEATLQFRVLPAWYQSWWFYGLCVLAVAGSGSAGALALHRGRARRASDRMEARFEAVLTERTRIARELHDTLLQGFAGIVLHLEGVRGKIVQTPGAAANELTDILRRADGTLREAREMVWDMRSPELAGTGLAGALEVAGRHALNGDNVDFRCFVCGATRRLPPAIETAVLRVGREAIVNALRHADPRSVVVELTYEPHRVRLVVRDDGRGAEPEEFERAAAGGHWGVAGMRERAAREGGALDVYTALGKGTRICLALPAEPLP